MGDQTLCSAFSPGELTPNSQLLFYPSPLSSSSSSLGGKYFVTGGTDHIIRVYLCIPGPPTLQAELEDQHTVSVAVTSSSLAKFVSSGFSPGIYQGRVCGHGLGRVFFYPHQLISLPHQS